FLAVAAELFARQPITEVRLSDRQSIKQGGGFAWFCTGVWKQLVDDVPAELWPHLARDDQPMITYATSDDADAALGRACVRYGRLLVGVADRPEGDCCLTARRSCGRSARARTTMRRGWSTRTG